MPAVAPYNITHACILLYAVGRSDQVKHAFARIAASLSGTTLSKTELDLLAPVVKAAIVNHARHDDKVHGGALPEIRPAAACAVS